MFGRLAMGFANVRAGTRVQMRVLVQAVLPDGSALIVIRTGNGFHRRDPLFSTRSTSNPVGASWSRPAAMARPAPFRASASAARTLNGPSRVTLSLWQEHLRAGCGPRQEERGLKPVQNKRSQVAAAGPGGGVPVVGPWGVRPNMLQLPARPRGGGDAAPLLLSTGRPGLLVWASTDGSRTWQRLNVAAAHNAGLDGSASESDRFSEECVGAALQGPAAAETTAYTSLVGGVGG